MKQIIFFLLTAIFSVSLFAQTPEDQRIPKNHILILSPQGVDPNIDTIGYNDIVRRITQAFSLPLAKKFDSAGFVSFNVIDQEAKYNTGEKLSIYSVMNFARKAIVISLVTEDSSNDSRMILRAQYIEQEFIYEEEKMRGVRPTTTLTQTYLLRSSKYGDNPKGMSQLADEFFEFLSEKKRM